MYIISRNYGVVDVKPPTRFGSFSKLNLYATLPRAGLLIFKTALFMILLIINL